MKYFVIMYIKKKKTNIANRSKYQTWVKYFLKVFRINTRILIKNSTPNMYSNTLYKLYFEYF
jgi:hypothetical protein